MFEAVLLAQLLQANTPQAASAPNAYRPITVQCFTEAAQRQQLEPWRLLAVMKQENGRLGMLRSNPNGSYDMGPMQVNTIHLPQLSRLYAVAPAQLARLLTYDGCFNVSVGAYLLRMRTNEANGDFWYGIGGYHSKTPSHKSKYILQVHGQLRGIVAASTAPQQQ